jgi:predicted ATP-grasp superfamily ATP-dependent carboligase
MNVLVTDGGTRPALAITRSLGRRGHAVVVAASRLPSLAQTSRYCTARVAHPDPGDDEAGAVDALCAAVAAHGIDVIVPVTDIAVSLVTRHRGRFEPRCRVPFAPAETIARANDKAALMARAAALGVPVPRGWTLAAPGAPVPSDLPFPLVVKPHRSRVRTASGWLACAVRHAATPAALEADLQRRAAEEFPLLLQERIGGVGLGVFACYRQGRPLAWFSHRRVREKPPWGGVSVLSESVVVPPRARDYAERLLADLAWDGVAMVEFKHDPRDDEPKLMEINPRFWGSLQLAIDAGVDFPALLVEPSIAAAPPAYTAGVRSRWFWGDVDALLLRLTAGRDAPPPLDGVGRLRAVAQCLALWQRRVYYDNPRSDDVRPWLFETREWFRRLM